VGGQGLRALCAAQDRLVRRAGNAPVLAQLHAGQPPHPTPAVDGHRLQSELAGYLIDARSSPKPYAPAPSSPLLADRRSAPEETIDKRVLMGILCNRWYFTLLVRDCGSSGVHGREAAFATAPADPDARCRRSSNGCIEIRLRGVVRNTGVSRERLGTMGGGRTPGRNEFAAE
jgi:hypothetical protein